MAKLKKTPQKTSILPMVLIILGIISLIYPTIITWNIVPSMLNLAAITGNLLGVILSYLPIALLFGIFLAQIVIGIILQKKQYTQGKLTLSQHKLAKMSLIVGIIATVITLPVLLASIITPIYTLLSE